MSYIDLIDLLPKLFENVSFVMISVFLKKELKELIDMHFMNKRCLSLFFLFLFKEYMIELG